MTILNTRPNARPNSHTGSWAARQKRVEYLLKRTIQNLYTLVKVSEQGLV